MCVVLLFLFVFVVSQHFLTHTHTHTHATPTPNNAGFFNPLVSGGGWVTQVCSIMSQPWFWGDTGTLFYSSSSHTRAHSLRPPLPCPSRFSCFVNRRVNADGTNAHRALSTAAPGTYLIRFSSTPSNYTISFRQVRSMYCLRTFARLFGFCGLRMAALDLCTV